MPSLPFLRHHPTGYQFIIDDTPSLLLGGQVHNSAPSSPAHMRSIWDHLARMNVGMVIGSASWALCEPQEGQFDFTHVDAQIDEARARGIRLVLIWFGAFKNAGSAYAPRWVRRDVDRFPRAVLHTQQKVLWTYPGAMPKPVLSVFSPERRAADQRAFTALLRHLAVADPGHVVVMIQVENETGVLGDSRDRSAGADHAWAAPVPAVLIDHLMTHGNELRPELAELWSRQGRPTSGTWAEVFGEDWQAEEVFMAWAFASHVEALAAAGKAVKNLPMFANAWIGPQPGQTRAGDYPSGGPTSRVLDVWKAAAPSLDLLAPDIYVPDVRPALADYTRTDNPLFVPEAQFRVGTLFLALGAHRAIGFSVFGIEDGRSDGQLAEAYALLRPMQDVITAAQAGGRIAGILLDEQHPEASFHLGGYEVRVRGTRDLLGQMLLDAGVPAPPDPGPRASETAAPGVPPTPGDGRPFGLLIAQSDDEFLIVGQGLTVDFQHPTDRVEIDHVEEGRQTTTGWAARRVLNGDERLYVVPSDSLGASLIRVLRTPQESPQS